MTEDGELVFVYGTLRRDGANVWRMEGGTFLRRGRVRGALYFTEGYPGLVTDQPRAGWVVGELWRVPSEKVAELDRYETGCTEGVEWAGFRKIRVEVARLDGTWADLDEAWAWEWTGVQRGHCRVRSGDWLDVERPRPPSVFTAMGCLSFFALPGGAVVLGSVLDPWVIGSSEAVMEAVLAVMAGLGTPVAAWIFASMGMKRRERGETLQLMAFGMSVMFFVAGALVLIIALTALLAPAP